MTEEDKYRYIRAIRNAEEAIEIIDCIDYDNDNSVNRGIDKMQEMCKKILEDVDDTKIKLVANHSFFVFDKTPLLHEAINIIGAFKDKLESSLYSRAGQPD